MPAAFLDGVRIPEESTRELLNAIGPLNGTCTHCGGSVIEIKSVTINARANPVFRIWCCGCGRYQSFSYDLPHEWYTNLVCKLEKRIQRMF
jgi:hypothetical protein